MKSFRSVLSLLSAVLFFSPCAQASVITFDTLPSSNSTGIPVYNGYSGLKWHNFYVLASFDMPDTGYEYGVVSPNNAVHNGGGYLASVESTVPFTLNSANFTSGWIPQTVTVIGSLGGTEKYKKTFDVFRTTPILATFGWDNVDKLTFISGARETQFVMDNLNVSSVPLPAALPLFGIAVGGMAFLRRRAR